ncbi:hypothetical protein EV426DRAFT_607764 [Tirmania nivea]|nr:hypothetical protein EV426DRAFT_607764 [Tirmania nivea]
MSTRAHLAVNIDLTPIDPDSQEHVYPIGVLPLLAVDGKPTRFTELSKHEHSEPPELYERSTTDEAPLTLGAAGLSNQPITQDVDPKDPPPVVVSIQGIQAAACRDSSLNHRESHPPSPSKGDFMTEANATLIFSSPYVLSRFFTIHPYHESLRHEAAIAVAEGRIQEGQNMFIERVMDLVNGIDTLFKMRGGGLED